MAGLMELSCQVGAVLGAHNKLAMAPPLRVAGMVKATGVRQGVARPLRMVVRASASEVKGVAAQDSEVSGTVRGVLFDMDGVLCDSEHCSRKAAVELFKEMGFTVTEEDFIPFMGTGTYIASILHFSYLLEFLSVESIVKLKFSRKQVRPTSWAEWQRNTESRTSTSLLRRSASCKYTLQRYSLPWPWP